MPNEEEVVQEVVEEQVEEQVQEVDEVEELRKKIATLEAQKEHWREKANKPVKEETPQYQGLSAGDLMAIKNADITEKDMDLVEKFAKDNGMPLRDALHHPHMKAILDYEKEIRNTAIATNVESVRRGAVKVSDDSLIQNASMGKLPTTDDEIEQLVNAKFRRK